jgi:hypothetical protein
VGSGGIWWDMVGSGGISWDVVGFWWDLVESFGSATISHQWQSDGGCRWNQQNVLGPVPEVDVMAKRPQGLLNLGTLSARMAVLRSCALDI